MGFDGISRAVAVVEPVEKILLYVTLIIMQILLLDICLTPFAVYLVTSSHSLLYLLNMWLCVNYQHYNHKVYVT